MLINPYSMEETSEAIRAAIDMPLEERKARWEKLNEVVKTTTVERWRENFVEALSA